VLGAFDASEYCDALGLNADELFLPAEIFLEGLDLL